MMAMPQVRVLQPRLVTRIAQDEPLVKVFTTNDVNGINAIERILSAATADIQRSNVRSPSDVLIGSTVLVPHPSTKFRRAEVIAAKAGGQTLVLKLLDIGGSLTCSIYEVRVIPPELKPKLLNIPYVRTEEYILNHTLTGRTWNSTEVDGVNGLAGFNEDSLQLQVVGAISSCNLLRINYKTEGSFAPFTMWLSDNGLSTVANAEQVQEAITRKYPPQPRIQYPSAVPPGFQPIQLQHQHVIPPTVPFAQPQQPVTQRPILPTPVSGNYPLFSSVRPTMTTALPSPRLHGPRPPPLVQPPEPARELTPQIFVSETLPVGSVHDVYVSYVIDGAQNFTVQLVSKVKNILTPLMVTINDTPAEPFTDPLQPGTICLGRYMNDNALCRAVVSTVLADGANLYFVDFGNSDIVPFNEIYKLQPKFLKEKMVAIRFSLAGICDDYLLTTKEAIKVFEQLVVDCRYPVKMEVVKPETPLKQFCNLFIVMDGKMVNVKDKMKDKMRVLHAVDYDTIPFKKGSQADVVISYFESPHRFFVQMSLNAPQLATIMKAIETYCLKSDDKEILFAEDLNVNVPVCAKFEEDGNWYRAQIRSEADGDGMVDVLFVDFGNLERMHFSQLRVMTNEMITLGPVQAVECRLDYDAEMSVREDVIAYFSEIATGHEFAMHVVNVLPAKMLLVDLIDKTNNAVLKDVLKERFSSSQKGNLRSSVPAGTQNGGNWRDRPNASNNDGTTFSAFRTKPTFGAPAFCPPDETDNVRTDSFEKRGERSAPHDGAPPRRFDRDGGREQSDSWKKSRQEETGSSWNDHDDRTTRKDDDGAPWNRNSEGGFRARGRDNDRDGAGGGRSFGRDGGERSSWKSGRDGEDRGADRKPWRDDAAKSNAGDSWGSRKKDDGGGWSGENRRGGDRFGDRGRDGDDRGGDRKPWNAEKKDDGGWSGGTRRGGDRDFKSDDNRGGGRDSKPWGDKSDDNRGGSRDSKPWGDKSDDNRGGGRDSKPWGCDRGGGFREKRDFGGGGGGGGSSWKSNDGGSSWGAPKAPTREPAYERGAQFVEPGYQPGTTLEVVVTWFVNPMQFYVMPANDGGFRAMMETFQQDYSKRETIDLGTLSPNECIVARDKDDVIYRARFLRSRPGGALVRFADYGNTATIREAWAANQEHCAVPIQAICCKLHGITKVDEDTPWSAIKNLDSHFEADKYTLTLVECIEESGLKTWSVNLTNASTNADVSDVLVESGVVVRANVLKSDELYDIAMLKDQTLAVHPGNIVSSKEFFVHIDRNCADMIQTQIAELHASKTMVPLPKERIVEGEFCLAPSEEEYFRALILSVDTTAETAHLAFIDFGDETDVPFSSLNVLPDHLAVHPAQIAECSLYQGESFENEDEFSTILGDDQIVKVMDVVDNKLQVILYNLEGVRLPYPTAVEEKISPICPLPLLRFNERVTISHIEKNKVYLQQVAYEADLAALVEDLGAFYEQLTEEEEKPALETDKLYAAKSAKFETWYRCKLVDAECKEVFYFDYGNTEPVDELLAIKLLDPKFNEYPMYSVGVSTNVQFTAEDVTPLIDVVQPLIFEATFKSLGPNEWYADLKCESAPSTFADYAVEAGCGEVSPSSEEKPKPHIAFPSWKQNEEKQVKVSHVNSPNNIFLQSVEDQPTVTSLMEDLQSSLVRVLPLIGPHDTLMAALNPADKKWYRAKPVSKDEVLALDFGFKLKSLMLKKLPKRFKDDESVFTTECSLNLQPRDGSVWKAELIAQLVDMVAKAESVTAKLEYVTHHVRIVDIKADVTSISEMFTSDGIAAYKANEVTITHANSLKDFYIQFAVDANEIDVITDRMLEVELWPEITEEPEAGKIFAAQFVDDEQWYRAKMVKTDDDGSKLVQFIDYGNEGIAVQLKALPDDLLSLPPYAVQCEQFPLPDNADELSEAFLELTTAAEENFTAFVMNGGVPMTVLLEYKNKQLIDVLTQKKALLEWELQPADVGDKVTVSHINSPSSFYVRSETATLEDVENVLATVESAEPLLALTIDDIVAAKFPEDDLWYRAKVIDAADGTTKLLFVDYGNQSEIGDVRPLPDGAKLTPCTAKHCSFAVPDGQSEWPIEATNRFTEMTGDNVFTITIKKDGEPALVDLLDDGMSVAEELATMSKADLTTPTLEASKEVVVLSHVESAHAVWIQYQSPQLDEMIDEMANAESFEEVESAEPEALVAALFEEVWYRAKVIQAKSEESDAKVLFIDYGNDAEATTIKRLPEDLAGLPALAKRCRLKENVPVALETSTMEKLKEYVAEAQTFHVDELVESDGQAIVTLCCCDDGKRGKQLAEILGLSGNAEVIEPTADGAQTAESASHEGVDAVEAVDEAALTEEKTPGEEKEPAKDKTEPQPSGEEQVIEALGDLKIASPLSEKTKVDETVDETITEDFQSAEEALEGEGIEQTIEDHTKVDEVSENLEEMHVGPADAEKSGALDVSVTESKEAQSSGHVDIESAETTQAITTSESAEDVIQKSPVITDQPPTETEEEPSTKDDKDVESAIPPVESGLDEAQLEDEADKFQTPPRKSSVDEFATPEGMLDSSSVTAELLDTSFMADETISAEPILNAPEFAGLFDSVKTTDLDQCDCLVSHVTDALDFYVQRTPRDTKCVNLMEKALKACADGGVLTKVENPDTGDILAAKVDEIWYRVKVMSASEVICIDHGKSCPSMELFALPYKLSVLPAFAHNCAVALPKSSESVNELFKEMVADGKVIKVKCVEQTNEKQIVDLRDDSSSVTQKLLERLLSN